MKTAFTTETEAAVHQHYLQNNYLHVQMRRKMLWQHIIDADAVESSSYLVPVYVVVQLQLHSAFQKTRDSP